MICASCGTSYEPPAQGAPYCPNNNCPLHQQLAGSLGLRQQADLAMKEAAMWAQAEQDAVAHLEDVRAKRKAAQGEVIAKLEAAKQQAADELEAIDKAAADLES